jgi:hypothetical protein
VSSWKAKVCRELFLLIEDLRSTGTSDLFVLIRAKNGEGSDVLTWKTKCIKKATKNPVWKEELVAILDVQPPLSVSFDIWDKKNVCIDWSLSPPERFLGSRVLNS